MTNVWTLKCKKLMVWATLCLGLPVFAHARTAAANQLPTPADQRLQTLIKKAEQISCISPSLCPEGVAGLVIRHNLSDSIDSLPISCQGALVSGQRMIIPKHCLPPSLHEVNRSCSDFVFAVYPPRAGVREDMESRVQFCNQVTYVSPPFGARPTSAVGPEFVVVTMVASDFPTRGSRPAFQIPGYSSTPRRSRTPLRIKNRGGFPLVGNVQLARIQPITSDLVRGPWVLRVDECRVSSNSLFATNFRKPDSPVFHLSPCEVAGGDSGSPVLDSDGNLVGIIRGFTTPIYIKNLTEYYLKLGYLTDPLSPWAFGANLTCQTILGGLGCSAAGVSAPLQSEQRILLNQKFNEWTSQANPRIRWSLEQSGPRLFDQMDELQSTSIGATRLRENFYIAIPECLQRAEAEAWAGRGRVEIMTALFYPAINTNFEFERRVVQIDTPMTIDLNASNLLVSGSTNFDAELPEVKKITSSPTLIRGTLKLCPSESR
jgi:hypothetical protein